MYRVQDSSYFDQTAPDPITDLLRQLYKKFKVFREFRPLRIGVDWELHQALPETPRKQIKRAIARHTLNRRYQLSLARGGSRYDLAGQENGVVPEAHRSHAKRILDRTHAHGPRPKPPEVIHRSVLHHAESAGKKRRAVAAQSIGVTIARRVVS